MLDYTKPIYIADHYKTVDGKLLVGGNTTFNAMDDGDAWRQAEKWSDSASGVLFQATHLRLRRDGDLVQERPLSWPSTIPLEANKREGT